MCLSGKKRAESFDETKALISTAPLLKYFYPAETVEVQDDASCQGLGACLMQGDQSIQYASRALTETEKRYSQIEKEMLSIVHGLARFHIYTYGKVGTVYNDHKRLAAILRNLSVEDIPARLQRMLCRIMRYDLEFKKRALHMMYFADRCDHVIPFFIDANTLPMIFFITSQCIKFNGRY